MEQFKRPGVKGTNSVTAQNKKIEGMRTALIAVERTLGKSIKEIAENYHISQASVKNALTTAAESGFLEHFRALVYERLAGKALAVYEAQLEMGNLEAARDIAFGLGVLQKSPQAPSQAKAIDTLAAYRAERAAQAVVVDSPPSTPSSEILLNAEK